MQTLGISQSTPRSESRLKSLFWPTIRNDTDFDQVTRQGFWVCFAVSMMTLVVAAASGVLLVTLPDVIFFFLVGVGVRQRSRFAAVAGFLVYFLGTFLLGAVVVIGVMRIVFLALLFANIRGNWLSARWAAEAAETAGMDRLNETLADKLSDQLPAILWPKARYLFYPLAVMEVVGILVLLAGRR